MNQTYTLNWVVRENQVAMNIASATFSVLGAIVVVLAVIFTPGTAWSWPSAMLVSGLLINTAVGITVAVLVSNRTT